jgi:hypothetical protein
MYEAVLGLILVVAALNRAARPFAFVMLANWAVNYFIVSRYGLYGWVPVVDAASFISMAFLTLHHPKWWSFLVAELAFSAVVVHVLYWTSYGFGLYLGQQYQAVLNASFILSALILVIGSYDIWRYVGAAIDSLARLSHIGIRRARTTHQVAKNHQEDAK